MPANARHNVRPEDLERLSAEGRSCRICSDTPFAGAPMLTEPLPLFQVSVTARLCIASQAPGTRARASMLAFDDPSGERLRTWMGITRTQFYDAARVAIMPMGFCFPGLDRHGRDLPPRQECAPTWRARFFGQMPAIQLIVCIGSYAQRWHLGKAHHMSMDQTVKNWRSILASSNNPRVLPLPHPSWRNNAWIKRNPWFEQELLPTLRAEVSKLL
jgi:uracil-DNA glycosylase